MGWSGVFYRGSYGVYTVRFRLVLEAGWLGCSDITRPCAQHIGGLRSRRGWVLPPCSLQEGCYSGPCISIL